MRVAFGSRTAACRVAACAMVACGTGSHRQTRTSSGSAKPSRTRACRVGAIPSGTDEVISCRCQHTSTAAGPRLRGVGASVWEPPLVTLRSTALARLESITVSVRSGSGTPRGDVPGGFRTRSRWALCSSRKGGIEGSIARIARPSEALRSIARAADCRLLRFGQRVHVLGSIH